MRERVVVAGRSGRADSKTQEDGWDISSHGTLDDRHRDSPSHEDRGERGLCDRTMAVN
jgi:hypothetical protein